MNRTILLAVLGLACGSSQAFAVTLPAGFASIVSYTDDPSLCDCHQGSTSVSGSGVVISPTGGIRETSATAALGSFGKYVGPPKVSVGVFTDGGAGPASAGAFVQYWFAVDGPSGVPVTLNISALGHAAGEGQGFVVGYLLLSQGNQTLGNLFVNDSPNSNVTSFSVSKQFTVISGDLYNVQMSLNAGILLPADFGNGFADIDPLISFVTEADASAFTLEFSSNVTNAEGPVVTPLPAALPLFATGLGALGLLGWRKRRKTAALTN